MGVLNSLGLWILGVDYPFLWGFLAAVLIIIPYLGTAIGGLLPILYVLGTGGDFITVLWIALMYLGLQQLEGNFITPKIMGDSIKVNPLVVIFSLLIGGLIWGIVGAIIALPLVGMFRIILLSIDPLKPVAIILGSDMHSKKYSVKEHFDEDKFRLSHIFNSKAKDDKN